MSGDLDATSLAIGRLQAAQDATSAAVVELKSRTEAMDGKLDRLLARQEKARLTFKHWLAILALGAGGGGGIAHALRKIFE